MSKPVVIEIPDLKLVSSANAREHWRKRQKRAMSERLLVRSVMGYMIFEPPLLPIRVTITRLGPRKLDSDNLAISAKHVRDEIAFVCGVDDGSDLYDWQYRQQKSQKYGVRIEIEPLKVDGSDYDKRGRERATNTPATSEHNEPNKEARHV